MLAVEVNDILRYKQIQRSNQIGYKIFISSVVSNATKETIIINQLKRVNDLHDGTIAAEPDEGA